MGDRFPLRYNTASQEVPLGPFLDDTDGKTAETGLTIANTDIKIWKSGSTSEVSKNSGGATHMGSGRYYAVLDATDTDTLGPLEINVHVAGALPCQLKCSVLTANAYDSEVAGTDVLQVDTTQISGTAQTGRDIGASVLLSPGSGVGQLDITSGVVKANLAQILGTALTETAGYIAAAFKMFFNVATPVLTAESVNQTGDAYAQVGAAGAGLTALGDSRLANLDATISSRGTADPGDAMTLTPDYDAAKAAASAASITDLDNLIDALILTVAALPADVRTALQDEANGIETGITPRQAQRIMLASCAGQLSGAATATVVMKNPAGSATRITATTDESGNRTAVTLGLT